MLTFTLATPILPLPICLDFSLQHQTLLPLPATSTAGCCFRFGSVSLFFLQWFLHSSPVAYWAPTDLGSSSFSVLSFFFFILSMGFSRQEYWNGLPFPSPVNHILSELSTMTWTSWVTLHGLAHSFIESMWSDWFVFCDYVFQSVCPLMEKDKRLMETSWWERLTEGKLEIVLLGPCLVQFSSVQSLGMSDSLWPHAACQASLSITSIQSLLTLLSIETLMPSIHLILCGPLLLPPSIFPSIRVFSN